jgi:hypothetical protein
MSTLRKSWTRDELLVVLNVYHKLTFGQLDHRNPVIVELAKRLGRTPGSVSMKLCNLASFDPILKLRGIKGLEGASILDGKVWNEFHNHLEESVPASEEALRKLFNTAPSEELHSNFPKNRNPQIFHPHHPNHGNRNHCASQTATRTKLFPRRRIK